MVGKSISLKILEGIQEQQSTIVDFGVWWILVLEIPSGPSASMTKTGILWMMGTHTHAAKEPQLLLRDQTLAVQTTFFPALAEYPFLQVLLNQIGIAKTKMLTLCNPVLFL
jgi:hypothetical protein